MIKYIPRNYINDSKYFNEISKLKVKCKCGHSQTVFKDKKICDWCGELVFKDKQEEFKYKVLEKLRRV